MISLDVREQTTGLMEAFAIIVGGGICVTEDDPVF
jgi:hypothetical protein